MRAVRQAHAAVTAGGAERIEQARAAAAVHAHAAVAAAELLQHVAVGGDREDVGAEEVGRVRAPDADDGEEAAGRGRRGRADDHAEAADPVAVAVDGDRAGAAATRRCASVSAAARRGRRRPTRRRGWGATGAAPAASSAPCRRVPREGRAATKPGGARSSRDSRRPAWDGTPEPRAREEPGPPGDGGRRPAHAGDGRPAPSRTPARRGPAAPRARAQLRMPSRRRVEERSDPGAGCARRPFSQSAADAGGDIPAGDKRQ